jgi:hypothetical protein
MTHSRHIYITKIYLLRHVTPIFNAGSMEKSDTVIYKILLRAVISRDETTTQMSFFFQLTYLYLSMCCISA